MKVRISVSQEKYDAVKKLLEEHGIEINDESEYLITESFGFPEFLSVRDDKRERYSVSVDEVVFIEDNKIPICQMNPFILGLNTARTIRP